MSVTFDQWLDILVDSNANPPEVGFKIQAKAHESAAAIYEWKVNNLSNSQIIEVLNFDGADPELTTVKVHLNGLGKDDTLALESAMVLAQEGISVTGVTYNKALLRSRFGL